MTHKLSTSSSCFPDGEATDKMFGMLESLRYIEIAYALWHVMHVNCGGWGGGAVGGGAGGAGEGGGGGGGWWGVV